MTDACYQLVWIIWIHLPYWPRRFQSGRKALAAAFTTETSFNFFLSSMSTFFCLDTKESCKEKVKAAEKLLSSPRIRLKQTNSSRQNRDSNSVCFLRLIRFASFQQFFEGQNFPPLKGRAKEGSSAEGGQSGAKHLHQSRFIGILSVPSTRDSISPDLSGPHRAAGLHHGTRITLLIN